VTVVWSTVQLGVCKDLSEIQRACIALLSLLYNDSAAVLCMRPNSCLDVKKYIIVDNDKNRIFWSLALASGHLWYLPDSLFKGSKWLGTERKSSDLKFSQDWNHPVILTFDITWGRWISACEDVKYHAWFRGITHYSYTQNFARAMPNSCVQHQMLKLYTMNAMQVTLDIILYII